MAKITKGAVKQIPAISGKVDPQVKAPLEAMRSILNEINKGAHPSLISPANLAQAGLATVSPSGTLVANALEKMPAHAGLVVTGAFSSILLIWDGVNSTAYSHTEIHRAMVDDIGQAVLVGTTSSGMFSDSPPNNSTSVTYYYWIRAVNKGNITGPFNATAGTPGGTADDPAYALEILAGQISESELASSLSTPIAKIPIIEQIAAAETLVREQAVGALDYARALLEGDAAKSAEAILQGVLVTNQVLLGSYDAAASLATAEFALSTVESDIALGASLRIELEAKLNASVALFSTDATAQIDALSAITEQFTSLQAGINENIALLEAHRLASVNRDSVEASARETLAGLVVGADGTGTASGLIQENKQLLLDADAALASVVDTLFADFTSPDGTVSAALSLAKTEAIASSNAAMITRTDLLQSEFDSPTGAMAAAIASERVSTLAEADSVAAGRDTELAVSLAGDLTSAISTLENVLATADAAATSKINTSISAIELSAEAILQNILSGNANMSREFRSAALIKQEETTRATELLAVADLITTLQAISGDSAAAIQTESSVRAMALAPDWVASTSYALDDIVAYNGAAKICTVTNADAAFTASNWSDYNITQAQYSVKTDVNGKVAGFALANNGVTSDFIINVDRFGIATGNPADPDSYPFVVANDPVTGAPTVYIKAASIQDATITNAHIGDLAADKITAGKITAAIELVTALIRGGDATSLDAGAGVYIDSTNGTFRIGDPNGGHLRWDGTNLTLTGDISAASGTFKGAVRSASKTTISTGNGFWLDEQGNLRVGDESSYLDWDTLNNLLTLKGRVSHVVTAGDYPVSTTKTVYPVDSSNFSSGVTKATSKLYVSFQGAVNVSYTPEAIINIGSDVTGSGTVYVTFYRNGVYFTQKTFTYSLSNGGKTSRDYPVTAARVVFAWSGWAHGDSMHCTFHYTGGSSTVKSISMGKFYLGTAIPISTEWDEH